MKKSEWIELANYLCRLSLMKSKYSEPIKELVVLVNENIFWPNGKTDITEVITNDNKQTSTIDGNNTRIDTDSTNNSN